MLWGSIPGIWPSYSYKDTSPSSLYICIHINIYIYRDPPLRKKERTHVLFQHVLRTTRTHLRHQKAARCPHQLHPQKAILPSHDRLPSPASQRPHPPCTRSMGASESAILLHSHRIDSRSQERAGRYSVQHSTADDPHHVLLVSKGSRYSAKLQGVLGSGGADGPTEVVSWRWGWSPVRFAYYVWVFKEGTFELLSDGGCVYPWVSIVLWSGVLTDCCSVINWCWESPQAERTGEKSVEFHKLV